ncbi:MAG: polysaccharide biosynthesis tyrosine autokinase, partial [Acidobacteriota bacterium]
MTSQDKLGRLRREVEWLKREISKKPASTNAAPVTDVQVANPTAVGTEAVALSELLGTLVGSRWLIAGIVFLLFLGGLGHAWLARPVYRADALLQVEKTAERLGALADRADVFEEEGDVGGEMELLKSRRVLGGVVDNLRLDIVARPLYFPLVGAAVARRSASGEAVTDPWFDLGEYAWGGENIEIETLDVPASYRGETFTLVAGQNGGYQLLDPNGERLADGVVGEPNETYLADGEPLTLLVSNLRARAGTHFELIRRPRLALIDTLKSSVIVKDKGEQEQSGLLQISLEGPDRKEIRAIINEIADIYVQQNLERKSAEAEKSLNFLEEQLAPIKQQMESTEAALNNYRLKQGSVDLPRETEVVLQRIVSIETQLAELNGNRQELLQKIKPRHPRIVALDAQIANLNGQLKTLESKVKRLPDTAQEIMRLSRDVEVNTQLYTFLLNRVQELKVVKAGPVSNVSIVDYAVMPYKPVWPKKPFLITVYLLLGLVVGVAAVFLRNALWGGVEDPDVVEKQLGLPVYAVVPHSAKQEKLFKWGQHKNVKVVLAAADPTEPAVESLRGLRTSLRFALGEAKNNVILITGPGPNVGKSFISINLAAVLASANNRVLLIEGDLRTGHLNNHIGMNSGAGLADLIADDISIDQVIHETRMDKLSIIPAGTRPPNPSELLLHERFASALDVISPQFDYVIIDSPPILAVTDAAIIGHFVGATLLVVKAGMHSLGEIEQSAKRLRQAGVNLCGVVFNDMKAFSFGYGRYYR